MKQTSDELHNDTTQTSQSRKKGSFGNYLQNVKKMDEKSNERRNAPNLLVAVQEIETNASDAATRIQNEGQKEEMHHARPL